MRLLVSSTALARTLNEIEFEKDWVKSVSLKKDVLHIQSNTTTVTVGVDLMSRRSRFGRLTHQTVQQYHRRWDWLKKLVNEVSEQPITLEINENVINIIFQY